MSIVGIVLSICPTTEYCSDKLAIIGIEDIWTSLNLISKPTNIAKSRNLFDFSIFSIIEIILVTV